MCQLLGNCRPAVRARRGELPDAVHLGRLIETGCISQQMQRSWESDRALGPSVHLCNWL